MISIVGFPAIMEFERPLMQQVIGKKMVVSGYYVVSLFHVACFLMLPFVKIIEGFLKSGDELFALLSLGDQDIIIYVVLYMPLLSFYGRCLKRMKPILLNWILEDQSLATAFKEVDEDPDLERAIPQVVGTEMHSVATWLLTKAALLFCALGCVIIYKEYRYIPMVSELPVGWFLATSGSLFYISYEMNYDALKFAAKRLEKIQAADS